MIQFYILLSLIIGFVIVTYTIPKVIYISNQKKLFDIPNERSAATKITPNLGGIGIFAGFYISLVITLNGFDIHNLTCLLLASVVMFLTGLKDDLIGLSARKKLFFQLLTALYLIILGNVKITNLHGILGIYELDLLSSTALSLLSIVGIINAYNLIDGIDGLAAGIGIVISITFGSLFILAKQLDFAIVSFSLTGSLVSFFFFNVFGRTNKIFMGDTGSLTLGVVFAFLTIKYLEMPVSSHHLIGSPAIAISIMILPVIDTLRVMSIRIAHGKSPFSADMNHIHHHLLRFTNGIHLHSTLIIIVANLTLIIFACSFVDVIGDNLMFLIILAAGFTLAYVTVLNSKIKNNVEQLNEDSIKVISIKSPIFRKQAKVADGK